MEFFVPGIPAPQGSKRHVGNGRMVESSKALKPWREDIVRLATAATGTQLDGAVAVEATFILLRPKSVTQAKRPRPTVKPDIDKLARAVLDALTIARTITDDAAVVNLHASKFYADGSEQPGVHVRVMEVLQP